MLGNVTVFDDKSKVEAKSSAVTVPSFISLDSTLSAASFAVVIAPVFRLFSLTSLSFIEVVTNNKKIKDINELEVVDNKIYANSYQLNNDIGLVIDKFTGAVNGVINFKGLRDRVKQHPELDVINGIAYNKDRKTFFVTGKKWDKIFEIEIFKQ